MKVLHSICQQIWRMQQWPQDWKRSDFIQITKKDNAKNAQTTTQLHSLCNSSHTLAKQCSKFFKPGFNNYVNHELLDVQAGFRKGRGTRDQLVNIHWLTEKAREFQKNICFIDYAKAFDSVDHSKLWKILQEMGISHHHDYLGHEDIFV